uniref:SHSP domain-containing protein n=1 Tax=Ditylenchus dipsaci TaxID=166011 RepID=A0A915ESD5_9BILA
MRSLVFFSDGSQVKLPGHNAKLNFDETGNFECTVDITGFEPEELTVYIEEDDIKVAGKHKNDNDAKSLELSFSRCIRIPKGIQKVELTTVNLDVEWKQRASIWAQQQVGAEYNDIFSHKMLNSRGKKSFYCCQLVEEAYKATSVIDYYKRLCPENPTVPQGEPGSHASILRASPGVELVASRAFDFSEKAENKD